VVGRIRMKWKKGYRKAGKGLLGGFSLGRGLGVLSIFKRLIGII